MRTPIIAANWKMHKTRVEAQEFLKKFASEVEDISQVEIVIGPSFTCLDTLERKITDSKIKLAAQNMSWEEEGAYTGEISPLMLEDLSCEYVILGHSERRNIFEEDDETINKKLHTAFDHGLTPILCVGESQEERSQGKTEAVLSEELEKDLENLPAESIAKMVIAYEPIWAIGTGESASPSDAQHGCEFVRTRVGELTSWDTAEEIRLQYGGSIKPRNAKQLMSQPDIDGGLIGSASLAPDSFSEIIRITEKLSSAAS